MDKNAVSVIDKEKLILKPASTEDYLVLKTWFLNKAQVLLWAGPSVSFEEDADTFIENLSRYNYQSFALSYQDSCVGFGQFQRQKNHLNLGRLAINPRYRGLGLSYPLINKLMAKGNQLGTINKVSLFVFEINKAALKSYQNLGFVRQENPSNIPQIKGCQYMVLDY